MAKMKLTQKFIDDLLEKGLPPVSEARKRHYVEGKLTIKITEDMVTLTLRNGTESIATMPVKYSPGDTLQLDGAWVAMEVNFNEF